MTSNSAVSEPDSLHQRARAMWQHVGDQRPTFALPTSPEQESVWDYPRPPRLSPDRREILVCFEGHEIARSVRAIRVLETASPPTFYLPLADVRAGFLKPASGGSHCEWKGSAHYYSIVVDGRSLGPLAWGYHHPKPPFEALADHVGFYPSPLECYVEGDRAKPQPGQFYAGWITREVVGPFKGLPGTSSW